MLPGTTLNNPYKVDIPFGVFTNTSSKSYTMLQITYQIPLTETNHMNFSFAQAQQFMVNNPNAGRNPVAGWPGFDRPRLIDVVISGSGSSFYNSTYNSSPNNFGCNNTLISYNF